MSRWNTTFNSQQALQRTQSTLDVLQSEKLKSTPLSPQAKEEYDRAIKVLKMLEVRFASLDPELFNVNLWGNLGSYLNNAKAQADGFSNSINISQITQVNAHLDEVLGLLKPIDLKFSEKDFIALTEADKRLNQLFLTALEQVKKKADEVKKQYDSLSGEISQGKVRLDKNDQTIESQKTRLDTSIAEFQKQFSAAQETRNLEFQKLLTQLKESSDIQSKSIQDNSNSASESRKSEWDKFLAASKKSNDEHLQFLEKRKKEVDDIYGTIGSAVLAGNFNDAANKERKAADEWRKAAFGLMIAMGLIAIAAFAATFAKTPDWETFLFRLGTALIIAVPAFYAANESSKHRNREKLIRKNFLELSAIDAYLVHLPEQKRNEIKGELSAKFFGVPEAPEKTESVSKKDLFGLIEKFIKEYTKGH